MGFVYVKMNICNPVELTKKKEVELLVDSGAIFSVIPKNMLEEIDVKPVDKRKFKVFGGNEIEREIGTIVFEYEKTYGGAPIAFGKKDDTVLLGATALESLGYEVDVVERKLKKVELLMM